MNPFPPTEHPSNALRKSERDILNFEHKNYGGNKLLGEIVSGNDEWWWPVEPQSTLNKSRAESWNNGRRVYKFEYGSEF